MPQIAALRQINASNNLIETIEFKDLPQTLLVSTFLFYDNVSPLMTVCGVTKLETMILLTNILVYLKILNTDSVMKTKLNIAVFYAFKSYFNNLTIYV